MIGRFSSRCELFVSEWKLGRALASERRLVPEWPPRSIFVLRNNDLGDVLVSTPLLSALRQRFPGARIAVGVGPWAKSLLDGNPAVDAVLDVPAPWFNKYVRTGTRAAMEFFRSAPALQALRAARFDLGIDPLGSAWGALLLVEAGVGRRYGTRGYFGGARGFDDGLDFDAREHVADRCTRFAFLESEVPERLSRSTKPEIFLSATEVRVAEGRWRDLEQGPVRAKRVLVSPGAGLSGKAWPAERFRSLVERFHGRTDCVLAIVGGPREVELCRRVAADRAPIMAGQLDVRQTIAFAGAADVVACNSSFLLHASAATGRPAVALLGPAFTSAELHQRQWGYEGLTRTLGPEARAGRGIAGVDEAHSALEQMVTLAGGRGAP